MPDAVAELRCGGEYGRTATWEWQMIAIRYSAELVYSIRSVIAEKVMRGGIRSVTVAELIARRP
jgi:hypothetical protein